MPSLAALFRPSRRGLIGLFGGSGVLHFVVPRVYESIVPAFLPRKRELVYLSGLGELVCAAGLVRRTSWAGPATAALLVAVWPANISMAVDSSRRHQSVLRQVASWGRVPGQIPLIRAALAAGRE
jgi:uncharacterized membrane protein